MNPAQFLNRLHYHVRDDCDTIWVLDHPLAYYSAILNCFIYVPAGFQTDGSSVPRVPIIYERFGGLGPREGVIHDYLFRANSIPCVSFMEANNVFKEAMDARNKPFDVRWGMYIGVCVGGYPSYHKKFVTEEL